MVRALAIAAVAILTCVGQAAAQTMTAAPAPKNVTGAMATTLNSIKPPKLAVGVKFMIDGVMSTNPACPNQTASAANGCTMNKLVAHRDSITIDYSILPAFAEMANLTAKVMLKGCYANSSQTDRPWRKSSPIIAKSKKCPFLIKGGLDPVEGTAVWKPSEEVPTATYQVRAYVVRNATMNGTLTATTYPVAYGDSFYFDIHGIDSRPTSMKVAASLCACIGPIMFLVYFSLTYLRKKNV